MYIYAQARARERERERAHRYDRRQVLRGSNLLMGFDGGRGGAKRFDVPMYFRNANLFFPEIQIWAKNVDVFSDAVIWRGNFTATVVSADSQIEVMQSNF